MDGDLIQGTLQSLLQNRQQLGQQQQQVQQQHLDTMRTPTPQTGPIQSMVSDYLMKYAQNPNMGWSAMASAVGAQTERDRKGTESQLLRQEAADAQEAKYAGEALKEADLFGRNLLTTASRKGSFAQPSPEQLRTVYTGLRNEGAQVAKGYNFESADQRETFIEQYANRGMQNYIDNFATQPTGPRGVQSQQAPAQMPLAGPAPQASIPQQQAQTRFPTFEPLPEIPQFERARGAQPPERAQTAPRNIGLINQELKRPEIANDPTRQLILQQELEREQSMLQGQPPQQQQPAQMPGGQAVKPPSLAAAMPGMPPNVAGGAKVSPPRRNLPQEEGAKQGAKEMASSYVKDYETVQAEATAAQQQKAAFDALQKIKPNTGLFANTEQVVGSLFSALGQDPTSPTIQNAMKTRSAEQILSQLTNASLKAEKGVQTKTDEVRIYKEYPKTTDFQKVWDFSIKLGQERAQRKLEQRDYFETVANENNGTPIGARRKWDQEMESDPITQYLGGKLIFRGDFLRAYENKYPDLGREGAIQKWREMEKDYRARGGKK